MFAYKVSRHKKLKADRYKAVADDESCRGLNIEELQLSRAKFEWHIMRAYGRRKTISLSPLSDV